MMKKEIIILGAVVFILISGYTFYFQTKNKPNISRGELTLYKTPNCGCCENYVTYLESQGFKVKKVNVDEDKLYGIKKSNGIPENLWSCHTAFLNNYFIEGHIPIEAIEKLLNEKPEIQGVALPEMPSGSPGMPGFKLAPFKIHSVKNGQDLGIFIEL